MLSIRVASAILLLPIAATCLAIGGNVFTVAVGGVMAVAAVEYAQLFRAVGLRPARPLLIAGVICLIGARAYPQAHAYGLAIGAAVLVPLVWHLIDYERGTENAGTDFCVTVAGILYLGWLGGYFTDLRNLPDGLWWLATTLAAVWLADTGAYVFGHAIGRHKMTPRLSPKKTWEGFVGGIVGGIIGAGMVAAFMSLGAGPGSRLSWLSGAVLGGLVGLLSPLGDLGISMLKRQAGTKDSGSVMPGHGGALDRIDSWLVAAIVGFYFVKLLESL